MAKESPQAANLRWQKLKILQQAYPTFNSFLDTIMFHLGFSTTWLQHDIASYMDCGPSYLMIQAQRSQAKTTIAAAYAVQTLIRNPKSRVLIVSAGGQQASDISTMVVRIINTIPELECLRPDPSNGDRSSTEAFDVHYSLKGIDKSPSIASIGITGNLPGKRSDLLIADDIESPKNATTAAMRSQLLELTKEFSDINKSGRILYLGTPQTSDSIYNTLPSRGFSVRIWTGRYPTPEQINTYGELLAPSILRNIEADPTLQKGGGVYGDQGQPTDPVIHNEEALQKKELDAGKARFQLQYMLNTSIADQQLHPLKTTELVALRLTGKQFPLTVVRTMSQEGLRDFSIHNFNFKLSIPHKLSDDVSSLTGCIMYVDPAAGGKNNDETAYAVTGFLNGNIYLLDIGGIAGGYSEASMTQLAQIAKKHDVNSVVIEKNMGYGAFSHIFAPTLKKFHPSCGLEDDYVTGQKELRIIDILMPIMGRGSLIIDESIIEKEAHELERYEPKDRMLHSVFFQLAKLTRVRGCLIKDDRIDALASAVKYWINQLNKNQEEAIQKLRREEYAKFMKDPLGHNRYSNNSSSSFNSTLDRFRRR